MITKLPAHHHLVRNFEIFKSNKIYDKIKQLNSRTDAIQEAFIEGYCARKGESKGIDSFESPESLGKTSETDTCQLMLICNACKSENWVSETLPETVAYNCHSCWEALATVVGLAPDDDGRCRAYRI